MTIRFNYVFGIMMLASVGVVSAVSTPAHAAPIQQSLIVMPHEDDESQAWSMIEHSSSNYKVFAYMTQGEQTANCAGYAGAFRAAYGEIAPSPVPGPKWSQACRNARMNSTLNFLTAMSKTDSSIPGNFTFAGKYTLPSNGTPITHCDGAGETNCITDRSVLVYSGGSYGKVLFFNMGDGDLNKAEVTWAIRAIESNRALLGIPTQYPLFNAIGPFYNGGGYLHCPIYTHPDHRAIHQALYGVNFGVTGYQAAATCSSDPDVASNRAVTATTWSTLMAVNTSNHLRTGLMQRYYGWLDGALNGWASDASTSTQLALFMRHQSFWHRF